MKLSIVIITYNRAEALDKCLASLVNQTFKNFEVIIVDGDSQDNTPQVVDKYSNKLDVNKFINPTPSIAKLRDYGWRKAKGKYVAWIDDDVVVEPQWAQEVVSVLDENKNIGGVSGPTLVEQELIKNRDVFKFYNQSGLLAKLWKNYFLEGKVKEPGLILKNGFWTPGSNFPSAKEFEVLKVVDYLEPCNMTYRRRLVEQVDGFDHDYYKDWCEADLAFKVRNLGVKLVFNPKAVVYHNISQTGSYSGRTAAKERMIDFYRFYFRHVYKPQYLFRFLTFVLFQNIYYTIKAIKDGNITWLGSWLGSIIGFKYLWQKNQ